MANRLPSGNSPLLLRAYLLTGIHLSSQQKKTAVLSAKMNRKKKSTPSTKTTSFRPRINWKTKEGEPISYADVLWRSIDRFMSKPLEGRLQELIDFLEKQGSKTDKRLAQQLRGIAAKVKTMDDDWGVDGVANQMAMSVDIYIEQMLPRYMHAMLYQLTIEGLITSTWSPLHYQEHMRFAAGLDKELSADTDDFIKQIHSRLIDAPRKKRNHVTPGGSTSPLKQYAHALCFHYERLRPVWKDAKSIFKKLGGGEAGREAVKCKYSNLDAGERWTVKAEYVGLPEKLINKLSSLRNDEESRPEYLAYEHAAHLCGFRIGESKARRNKQVYSLKQIERVIKEHKKMLGVDYYNSLFKSGRRWTVSGDSQ